MEISRVGVDLAKNVFQLHGADDKGETVWKRKLSRDKWLKVLFTVVKPGTEIGMEACAGAHHWARVLHAACCRLSGEDDSTPVRQAFCKKQQERRQRCAGNLRSNGTTEYVSSQHQDG